MKSLMGLQALVGVATVLLLTSCGKSLQDYGRIMQRELGITVSVKAGSDDECAKRQLQSLGREFKSLSKQDQVKFRTDLQAKVRTLVIDPTRFAEAQDQTLYELSLLRNTYGGCYGVMPCHHYGGNYGNTKLLEGSDPAPEAPVDTIAMVLNDALGTMTLTSAGWRWKVTDVMVSVDDPYFFAAVNTVDDLRKAGKPFDNYLYMDSRESSDFQCAPPLRLSQLSGA